MTERRRPANDPLLRSAGKPSLARILPDNLHDYAVPPTRRTGRPSKHDLAAWTVSDDWPERVPVTDAEVDVFEAWFGDLFDELFGPCR
ncbi:MAG: hypothetical protein WCA81_07645 [Rhizomicrobium sp.]